MSSPDSRLEELKLQLPPAPTPMGVYKPVPDRRQVRLRFGSRPATRDGTQHRRPRRRRSDGGRRARRPRARWDWRSSRRCARISAASTASSAWSRCSAWSTRRRISTSHPAVINGCSELFAEIWGPEQRRRRAQRRRHGIAAGQHRGRDRSDLRAGVSRGDARSIMRRSNPAMRANLIVDAHLDLA